MATLGREPVRIDVLTSIAGVSFGKAWRGRLVAMLGSVEVAFFGLSEFRRNKAAAARLKDRLALLPSPETSTHSYLR